MIEGMMGAKSVVHGLKEELGASMVRSREIAHRIANASNDSDASFEASLSAAMNPDDVDLEVEMVKLADEQIRYEAMGQILQKFYGHIRSSMRSV